MNFKSVKQNLIRSLNEQNNEYKKDLALQISQMLIEARIVKGLTQTKLAKITKIKQSNISRAENGTYIPTLTFLQRIAYAYGTYLVPPIFEFMITPKEDIMFTSINTIQTSHLVISSPTTSIAGFTASESETVNKRISYPYGYNFAS